MIIKKLKMKTCVETLTSWESTQDRTSPRKSIRPRDNDNATQVCKAFEPKQQIFGRHHQEKQKHCDKAEKCWTEKMKFNIKYDKWNSDFIKMMQKYESV